MCFLTSLMNLALVKTNTTCVQGVGSWRASSTGMGWESLWLPRKPPLLPLLGTVQEAQLLDSA